MNGMTDELRRALTELVDEAFALGWSRGEASGADPLIDAVLTTFAPPPRMVTPGMVERGARALHGRKLSDPERSWRALNRHYQDFYREEAEVVLAAALASADRERATNERECLAQQAAAAVVCAGLATPDRPGTERLHR